MKYLNYSKQNENNPDCVAGSFYGSADDQYTGYFHFISKQEIQLPKQQLIDINFGLSFDLGDRNHSMIMTLHPSLANQGVILPGGAIIVPYRYREPFEIKLISFVNNVVIKSGDIILEALSIRGLTESRGAILRKKLNPLDTKLAYIPDQPSNPEMEASFEKLNIDDAINQWRKGIKDPVMLKLYPEGDKIYEGIPFGIESEENLRKAGGLLNLELEEETKEESKE